MRVWRLVSSRHSRFDGEGARRFGGRWNRAGTAVIYLSATISLAALEYFVHLEPEDSPRDVVLVPADIPDDLPVHTVEGSALPKHWRSYPASEALAEVGTAWARSLATAVLRVPSALVPQESNFVLNPAPPDFHRIAVGKAEPFSFDPRLRKRR